MFVQDLYRNHLLVQHQEFRLQVKRLLLFVEALLSQGHGVVALIFLPAALSVTRLDLHSSAPVDLLFLIISGRVQDTEDFGLGIAMPERISAAVLMYFAVFRLKSPNKKTRLKPF